MEINATHTVYGNFMNLLMRLRKPYVHTPFTTLNEKFNIFKDERPTGGTIPTIGYLMVGNGGHYNDIINNDIAVSRLYQHESTDANCFRPMPLVVRPIANDLTPAQRAGYAMRRVETLANGQQYVCYYLKRIDLSNVEPRMEYRTINPDKSIVVSQFIPNISNLNPSPKVTAVNGVNTTTSQFIAVSAKAEIPWSRWEIDEYLNAANIIHGTTDAASISEVMLVSGVDKTVQVSGLSYVEAIVAMAETFALAKIDLTPNSTSFSMFLDIGNSEPLFNIQAP